MAPKAMGFLRLPSNSQETSSQASRGPCEAPKKFDEPILEVPKVYRQPQECTEQILRIEVPSCQFMLAAAQRPTCHVECWKPSPQACIRNSPEHSPPKSSVADMVNVTFTDVPLLKAQQLRRTSAHRRSALGQRKLVLLTEVLCSAV